MVYVGTYALIYQHFRGGLPRGVLPSGILKIEKYYPDLKTLREILNFKIWIIPFDI